MTTRLALAAALVALSQSAAARPPSPEKLCWVGNASGPVDTEYVGLTSHHRWAIVLGDAVRRMCGLDTTLLQEPGRARATILRHRFAPSTIGVGLPPLHVEPRWLSIDARSLSTQTLLADGSALFIVHRRTAAAAPIDLASTAPTELRIEIPADALDAFRRCFNPEVLERSLLDALPPGPNRSLRPGDPAVPRELRKLEVIEDLDPGASVIRTHAMPRYRSASLMTAEGARPVIAPSLLAAFDALPRTRRVPTPARGRSFVVDLPGLGPRTLTEESAVEVGEIDRGQASEVSRVAVSRDGGTALLRRGEVVVLARRNSFGRWVERGSFWPGACFVH